MPRHQIRRSMRIIVALTTACALTACVGTANTVYTLPSSMAALAAAPKGAIESLNRACITQASNDLNSSASLLKSEGFTQPAGKEGQFQKPGVGYGKLEEKRGAKACSLYVLTDNSDALSTALQTELLKSFESVRYLPRPRVRNSTGERVVFHSWALKNANESRFYASVTPPLDAGLFAGHSAVIFGRR